MVALEWRVEGIRVWVFPRSNGKGGGNGGITAVPPGKTPDPSVWGQPLADFPATNCDVGSHFRNQSIVVNIDLCGYLTEAVWEDSGCSEFPFLLFSFLLFSFLLFSLLIFFFLGGIEY